MGVARAELLPLQACRGNGGAGGGQALGEGEGTGPGEVGEKETCGREGLSEDCSQGVAHGGTKDVMEWHWICGKGVFAFFFPFSFLLGNYESLVKTSYDM